MAVGDISGSSFSSSSSGNSSANTVDVRAQLVPLSLANVRALTASLAPGEILTGRISADLGDGKIALTVRGQTIIASSQILLPLDSVVKLLVHSSGDQPVLRLLTATFPDVATTTTSATRAAALGLPNTAMTAIALQAFEQVGAALDPLRLKDAVAQLQVLPPAQMPQRALALGLLADAGLPTTAPFIALAERSATGVLPNPAAALAALKTTVQTAVQTPAQTTERVRPDEMIFQPTAKGNVAPSAFASGQPGISNGLPSPGPTAGTTLSSSSASTVSPSVVHAQSVILPTKIPTTDQSVTTATLLPASIKMANNGSAPGAVAQPWSSSQSAPAATQNAAAAIQSAPPPATVSASVVPGSASASTLPTSLMSIPAVSLAFAPHVLAASLMASGPLATTTTISSASTLLGTIIPDLERDGASAAMQALSLAGVRPRHHAEVRVALVESPLIHRFGALVNSPAVSSLLPAQLKQVTEIATRHESPTPMDAAVAAVMREQVAETLVKPRSLADYELVLALPMQAQGQPTPARLAVAERHTAGGTATFVRVDAELTHLGLLSVRLSGIEGGPMAITLLAAGPALAALVAALPNLSDSLRELGLTAGLRVADLAEDHPHG